MDMQKERELFNKEFGISDADIFPATEKSLSDSAVLKCNWLGWIKRAEYEYRENPEKIEIEGLETIHKLCDFGAEHGLEGCTFAEIVECMFDDLKNLKSQVNTLDEMLLNQGEELSKAKNSAVPDGYCIVPKEPTAKMIEAGWLMQSMYDSYKAMIEAAQEQNQ